MLEYGVDTFPSNCFTKFSVLHLNFQMVVWWVLFDYLRACHVSSLCCLCADALRWLFGDSSTFEWSDAGSLFLVAHGAVISLLIARCHCDERMLASFPESAFGCEHHIFRHQWAGFVLFSDFGGNATWRWFSRFLTGLEQSVWSARTRSLTWDLDFIPCSSP